MKKVIRTTSYQDDLDDMERYIAKESVSAAQNMWWHIDDQVEKLANPNFPRRVGRAPHTSELVAHKNYIVIFEEDDNTVTALNVIHAKKKYP